jgi:hypothetical protein
MADVVLSDAEKDVQFGNLTAVEKVAADRRRETVGNHQVAGAGIGAGVGTALGSALSGIVTLATLGLGAPTTISIPGFAAVGAGIGSLIGTITGEIAGSFEASNTKNDETLQNAVAKLAEHVSEGGGTDFDSMFDYLHNTMKISADEAKILAREFSEDLDSLTSYGETIHQIELQQKAVYS